MMFRDSRYQQSTKENYSPGSLGNGTRGHSVLGSPDCSGNHSPLAESSPVLRRRVKRRRFMPDSQLEQVPPSNTVISVAEECLPQSPMAIQDDSFINNMNFEELDRLSAPTDHSTSIAKTGAPHSPEMFEDQSLSKTFDSQASFLTSLSSTISSQPLVSRIQENFGGLTSLDTGQPTCGGERRKKEVVAALEESALTTHQPFNLGPFFGLQSSVLDLLNTHRGITKLYKWQEECIMLGGKDSNMLISLPTSGGKTLVAEVLLWQQLLLKNRDALFILPYVALVQEKVRGLAPFGVELGFLVEEYASSRGAYPPVPHRKKRVVYVATLEKASGLVNSLLGEGRAGELGLAVVDEVHMVGDLGGRGATLEDLLTKLRFAAPHVQVVAMSATIGNTEELANFLDAKIYSSNFRPVQLVEYVMMDQQVCQVNPEARTLTELFTNVRTCSSRDQVAALVWEVIPQHSCLVFCPTKSWCENEALRVCRVLPKELKKEAVAGKKVLLNALKEEGGGYLCPVLNRTIPYGIAYHHSGLTDGERHLVEEAYLQGTICTIFCTSTLAAGINLPAKRVVILSPYTGRDFLTRARYKQMVGRAGRAGLNLSGESFLIIQKPDLNKVGELLLSPLEVCVSAMAQEEHHGLTTLLFSSIGLGVAVSLPQLRALAGFSLLALQASRLDIDLAAKVTEIVENLRQMGLVRIKVEGNADPATRPSTEDSGESCERSSSTSPTSALENLTRCVEDGDTLMVSRLGRAAIKGNIKYTVAKQLFRDLLGARDNLSVNTYLHLLYLAIPYECLQPKIDPSTFEMAYSMLGEEELKLAHSLHISQAVVVRVMTGKVVKKVPQEVLNRFYNAMKLHAVWNGRGVWETSERLSLQRGDLQQLLNATTAFASCVSHFCAEMEELWAFRDLLANIIQKLTGCCTAELAPLLDLPGVKQGRAKMLYKAGLRTLQDVAKSSPREVIQAVTRLSYVSALEMINSAKMLLIDKAETLQMEAEEMIVGISPHPLPPKPQDISGNNASTQVH